MEIIRVHNWGKQGESPVFDVQSIGPFPGRTADEQIQRLSQQSSQHDAWARLRVDVWHRLKKLHEQRTPDQFEIACFAETADALIQQKTSLAHFLFHFAYILHDDDCIKNSSFCRVVLNKLNRPKA